MDNPTVNILSLFSGVGMLDFGIGAALDWFGVPHRVAGYCEWNGYAAATLLARMEVAALERAPVWSDCLSKLDARDMRGQIDIVCGGPPCQPYSVAGKQLGHADERSAEPLYHTLRIISECRPSVVFFENVPPWVRGGWFRPVGEELCRMGYTLESPLFLTAKAVGASHKRERVFVLAHTGQSLIRRQIDSEETVRENSVRSTSGIGGRSGGLDDTAGPRHGQTSGALNNGAGNACLATDAADWGTPAAHERTHTPREVDHGIQLANQVDDWATPAARDHKGAVTEESLIRKDGKSRLDTVDNQAVHFLPPAETETSGTESSKPTRTSRPRLNPVFDCWLMGFPVLWTHPEPISCDALGMVAYRSALRSRLHGLLSGLGF